MMSPISFLILVICVYHLFYWTSLAKGYQCYWSFPGTSFWFYWFFELIFLFVFYLIDFYSDFYFTFFPFGLIWYFSLVSNGWNGIHWLRPFQCCTYPPKYFFSGISPVSGLRASIKFRMGSPFLYSSQKTLLRQWNAGTHKTSLLPQKLWLRMFYPLWGAGGRSCFCRGHTQSLFLHLGWNERFHT